jgi:hypothetical protein
VPGADDLVAVRKWLGGKIVVSSGVFIESRR